MQQQIFFNTFKYLYTIPGIDWALKKPWKNKQIVITRMNQHTINRKQSKSQKVYTAYNGLA